MTSAGGTSIMLIAAPADTAEELESFFSPLSARLARQEVYEYFQHHRTETELFITLLKEAVELDELQYDPNEVQPEQEDFMDPALFEQDGLHN